jgi:hypothetical protein
LCPDNTVRIYTICVSLGAMIVFGVGKDGALKPVKPERARVAR